MGEQKQLSPIDDELQAQIVSRLKRIEGQARGIQKMIEEKRKCEDIVIQLAAMKAAIVQVGMMILGTHMMECFGVDNVASEENDASLQKFMTVFTKFS